MALSESIEYDKIEIVGLYKTVQVRKASVIKKDGVEIVTTMRQQGDKQWAEYWLEERFRREHKQVTDFNLARSGESMPLPKAFFKQEREHYENISADPYEWSEEGH